MRKTVYLNGEWDFMPDFESRRPSIAVKECVWQNEKIMVPSSWKWKLNTESGYEPYNMFNYPDNWDDANSGVLGRVFEVHPKENQRVFLIFKGVLQNWQVFINDISVLESQEVDIDKLSEFKIEDVMLEKGRNRLASVFFGGNEDIMFYMCFINKYGDFIKDLKYQLTID